MIILTHHKNLLNDGVSLLIDDRTAHGADKFGDRLVLFNSEKFPGWKSVTEYLLKKIDG